MPKKTKKDGGGKMKEEASASEVQSKEETADKNIHSRRTLTLKAKLETEKKNSSANILKVNESWRSILRQTQDPELRQHIMMLKKQFEGEVDGLDSDIKNLECGLMQRERQSAQVRCAHLQNVESLCALQDKRLNLVQQPWEDCMQHISSKFNPQRELMLPDSQQQEDHLEAAMFLMEGEHKAVMEDMHNLYLESATLYEIAYEERKEAAMKKEEEPKEKPMEEPKNDRFKIIMGRNTFEVQDTNIDMKEMMRMKHALMRKKQTLNQLSTKEDVRAQQQQERLRLHNQLAQAQKDGRKRLTNLTIQSNNAAKKLQTVIAKGERLLHVGEVCQKLESKLEKASAISFSTAEHQAKEVSEFPELRQLTQCLNDAVLQRETLKKHKVELKQENEQLKLQLREHLDDMILSNNTFNGPDAPLTVHRAPTTRAPNTNTPNTNTPNIRAPTANTLTTTKM